MNILYSISLVPVHSPPFHYSITRLTPPFPPSVRYPALRPPPGLSTGDPASPPRSPPPVSANAPYRSPFTLAYYNHAQDEDMTALRHARARRASRASRDSELSAAENARLSGNGSRPTTPSVEQPPSGASDTQEILRQTSATSLAVTIGTVRIGEEAAPQHTVDMYKEGAGWGHTARPVTAIAQHTARARTGTTPTSPGKAIGCCARSCSIPRWHLSDLCASRFIPPL